jgi:hypothetical protein
VAALWCLQALHAEEVSRLQQALADLERLFQRSGMKERELVGQLREEQRRHQQEVGSLRGRLAAAEEQEANYEGWLQAKQEGADFLLRQTEVGAAFCVEHLAHRSICACLFNQSCTQCTSQ